MKSIQIISNKLDQVTSNVTGILVIILSVLTFAGVLSRFVFNNPIIWLYEFSIICFTWIIFLGTAMAFKKNEHIGISFVVMKLPVKIRYIWQQIIYLICIALMVIVIKEGLAIVASTWKQTYNTIPISKGIFYLSFPIGAMTSVVHLISHMTTLKVAKKDMTIATTSADRR